MGIFKISFSFIAGTISGIYIAQNYDVPNVKKLGNDAVLMAKRIEAKYRKTKRKEDDV